MPTVRMRHEEHGWTHAYTAQEVEEHEKNGWVVEVPEPKQAEPEEPPKRGRPPKAK